MDHSIVVDDANAVGLARRSVARRAFDQARSLWL